MRGIDLKGCGLSIQVSNVECRSIGEGVNSGLCRAIDIIVIVAITSALVLESCEYVFASEYRYYRTRPW